MSWLVELLEHACWRKDDKRRSREALACVARAQEQLQAELEELRRRNSELRRIRSMHERSRVST